MECLFCRIAEGEEKANMVGGDDFMVAFRDINPKAPVHVLVVPKVHIESIAHLAADQTDIVARLVWAAKNIAEREHLAGYKLVFNVGRAGGQAIDHVHLHLLGGWEKAEDWKQRFSV